MPNQKIIMSDHWVSFKKNRMSNKFSETMTSLVERGSDGQLFGLAYWINLCKSIFAYDDDLVDEAVPFDTFIYGQADKMCSHLVVAWRCI